MSKNKPAKLPGQNQPKPETLMDKIMFVLSDDLKQIALNDPEQIHTCLMVQACRSSNKVVNTMANINN